MRGGPGNQLSENQISEFISGRQLLVVASLHLQFGEAAKDSHDVEPRRKKNRLRSLQFSIQS